MTSRGPNLLADLREGTHANHRRVESHALLRPLMAPALTLEQYSRVIAAFIGFYASLESRIKDISARIALPGYQYQSRLPLLLNDLAALPDRTVVPCAAGPEYSRDEELVGVLYVLEGATQGGRIIAPKVQQGLALSETFGAQYFNFYRQDSWKEFRNMVERLQKDYDYLVAVAAARATFDHLYKHLDCCLDESGEQLRE